MGFVKGKKVTVIKNAPLQDPVEYEIMGYNVSLRRSEAKMIMVTPAGDNDDSSRPSFNGTRTQEYQKQYESEAGKTINVALAGNPNSGKTTLFNHASGSQERVGNFSGVTVDAKQGMMKKGGYRINIVDLPGTYSITGYSPEELYVNNHIIDNRPDIVVNVVDASNLERNLYLTTQLIDMNIRVVIALNMYDELEKKGVEFEYEMLGKMIGIPIIPTVSHKGKGIEGLFSKIIEVYEDRDPTVRSVSINYGMDIEDGIRSIQDEIEKNQALIDTGWSRYIAIRLIEKDTTMLKQITGLPNMAEIESLAARVITQLEKGYSESTSTILADARYGFIDGALKETRKVKEQEKRKVLKPDDLLTHKMLGFPIFIFFMYLMFNTTFKLGSYPMDWIDSGIVALGNLIGNSMPESWLRDMIVDGIIGGVGGVIIFLPNILILFFFISLMEDTGYMARTAFILDKLMHKIGLHGKSFIPLLMGFGCNVPAIMATRTLENKSDRILTMLIAPFMSCSARLPVYVLIISAFFPNNQGLILFSIYSFGILMAVTVALIMKKSPYFKKEVPFVMELPPYRIPTLKNTSMHMWFKAKQYVKKMGTVILVASVVVWALGYFPREVEYSQDYDRQIEALASSQTADITAAESEITRLHLQKDAERQEQSYIGRLGHFVEPAIEPLGFDWKIGVSLISGLIAKEIVVSTMGVLYQAGGDAGEDSGTLVTSLRNEVYQQGPKKGEKVYSPLVAISFMLFILIYFPCVAVIAAIRKESNWKWAVFTMFYTTALAWIVSFVVFQTGSLLF
jgi:ferrous iron transport protein B